MKTEQEILEADKREAEIAAEKEAANKLAHQEFYEATKEEWDIYTRVWNPARERWEQLSKPHFEKLKAKLIANSTAEGEALAELRSNWGLCPRCGASAGRYQLCCSNEKCSANFAMEKLK